MTLTSRGRRTLIRRRSLTIGVIDGVLLGVWTEHPASVGDVQECLAAVLTDPGTSAGVGLIVAFHERTPLPEQRVREAIQRDMQRLDRHLRVGATVIGREGFAGSAMRAVSSTLQLLARPSHPEKIVSTPADAAKFVCAELARHRLHPPVEQELVDAYDLLTREVWAASHETTRRSG